MIAAFLKKTYDIDLEQPITSFVKQQYGKEKATELALEIKSINALRKSCMITDQTASPNVDIPKYTKYYQTLCMLEKRFPFGEHKTGWFSKTTTVMVPFQWTDAYRHNERTKPNYSIKLEKMAVLYNLAALLSLQAVKLQSQGDQGIQEACKRFREAAGAFKFLSQQSDSVGINCTVDIQKDSANMLCALMLAQAQACFFEMASKKKISASMKAKLAMGSAQLFEKTAQMIDVNQTLKGWIEKSNYNFKNHCIFQEKCFKAAAEYWQSQQVSKQGKDGCFGLEVARLSIAQKYLNAAAKLSKGVVPALEAARKNLLDHKILPRYREVKKDNDDIYHEPVPSTKDLTPVQGKQNVKLEPFKLGANDITDPFSGLVSKEVAKQAQQMKSDLLASSKDIINKAKEATDLVRGVLASMGLPTSLESLSSEAGIPDSVWNRIAEVQKLGGVSELESIYAQIEAANTEAWKSVETIDNLITNEEKTYNNIKSKMGTKYQVNNSSDLNGKYKDDLEMIKGFLSQAVESNSKLESQIQGEQEKFVRLEKQRDDLALDIPKVDEQKSNETADKLRGLLDELSECISEREKLQTEYNETLENLDLSSILSAKETGVGENQNVDIKQLTSETVGAAENKITENISKQESLMDSIKEQNELFTKSKSSNPTQVKRENILHELNTSCETYQKCHLHLSDGLKFYMDLAQDYIQPLEATVKDFVMARESERDMHLNDLGTSLSKLGLSTDNNSQSSSNINSPISNSNVNSNTPMYNPNAPPQNQNNWGPPPNQQPQQQQWSGYNPNAPLQNQNQWGPPPNQQQQWGGNMPNTGNNPPVQWYGNQSQQPPINQQNQWGPPPNQQYGQPQNQYNQNPYYGNQQNPYYGNPNQNQNNNQR